MATNELSNVAQIVRALLLGDSSVSALVDGRIHSGHIVNPDDATLTLPAIIIDFGGGGAAYNARLQTVSFDIYAYSNISVGESMEVYKAVYDALQATRLTLDNVATKGLARETSRPAPAFNDQVKAWAVRGSWTAITAG